MKFKDTNKKSKKCNAKVNIKCSHFFLRTKIRRDNKGWWVVIVGRGFALSAYGLLR